MTTATAEPATAEHRRGPHEDRYPVTIDVDYAHRRSRATTLLRLPLAAPLIAMSFLYNLAATAAAALAWLPLLITGCWPVGLYELNVAVVRYIARANAYILLATDRYPPLTLRRAASHPVHVHINGPPRRYSRLKVLFRAGYLIPAYLTAYAVTFLAYITWITSWWAILATGRQPAALQHATVLCLRYTTSVYALTYLVTETYPPLTGAPAPAANADTPR